MGPVKALYDTNIVIDFLKDIPAAVAELSRNPLNYISVISWIEVMAGTRPEQNESTRAVLASFMVLPITPSIAERAAILRRDLRIKLTDAIILATAQLERRTLITRNTRDFSAADPSIHIPYTL